MNDLSNYTLNDLPISERPRERLKNHGAKSLAIYELLSIILGKGTKGATVIELSQKLLKEFGNLQKMSEASLEELMAIKGIGFAKATQIIAVFEINKRIQEIVKDKTISIKSAEDVARIFQPRIKNKKKEAFYLVCLDTRNNLIHFSIHHSIPAKLEVHANLLLNILHIKAIQDKV